MKSSSKLVAKAALFNDKNELLVLTRSSTDTSRPGEFDFPGGRLDDGESPDEAVIREIEEEVGLSISVDDLRMVYTTTSFYEGTSTVRFLYVGKIGDQEPKLSFEHDAWQWMPLADVIAKYNHPTWVGGLRYLLEHDLLK